MEKLSFNLNNNYSSVNFQTNPAKNMSKKQPEVSFCSNKVEPQPFVSTSTAIKPQLRTSLNSQEEQKMYLALINSADKKTQKSLETLLKTGILLSSTSNNSLTTLQSLYNIVSKPRVVGLDSTIILQEVVKKLENPFSGTQKFGDVPESVSSQIEKNQAQLQVAPNRNEQYNSQILNSVISSCCAAASIEFDLAKNNPSEFARFAEGLTSPAVSVSKNLKVKDISENWSDSIWLLDKFKTPYKFTDEKQENVEITLKPDINAIIRARVQNSYKDKNERSCVDVLMQSMIMQTASQQSYNTLTDIRTGDLNSDNTGLTDVEKNYAENLVTGKNKISVTYQQLDDEGKIVGYETSFDNMKKQIKDALAINGSVIVGYTQLDNQGKVFNGHEITIVGIEKDKKGKEYFVCNDTDDELDTPIKYEINSFLPSIHHAGLPKEVLKEDVEFVENWVELLNYYQNINQNKTDKNVLPNQQGENAVNKSAQSIKS